jgi:hypothetical protein
MSAANSRSHALDAVSAPEAERPPLFKEDRPRRIDRFISFFGDDQGDTKDVCGEELLESLSGEHWSER